MDKQTAIDKLIGYLKANPPKPMVKRVGYLQPNEPIPNCTKPDFNPEVFDVEIGHSMFRFTYGTGKYELKVYRNGQQQEFEITKEQIDYLKYFGNDIV